MPGFTPYFGLAFFNLGDNQADLANVALEMDRFVIIDKELYGLYSVFGSGVINGWEVVVPPSPDPTNIAVVVNSGIGIVNMFAAETLFSVEIDNLSPNQTLYIFAQQSGLTGTQRSVNFFASASSGAPNSILLAQVVTGDTGVVSIDMTVRQQIGFQALIDEEIAQHRHRGSPSKIDLLLETKNQLPGYKVGNQDASIVTSGKLSPDRLGPVDHSSLSNIGVFTHVALDAMVRKLSGTTDQLMGVISLINQLREILFLKYVLDDPDKEWYNTLAFVPGISPDSFIDFEASNASINLASNCISGYPVSGGQAISIIWNTQTAFSAAYLQTNVSIDVPGVTIARADVTSQLVEGFEEGTNGNVLSSFVPSIVSVDSNTQVTADNSVETQGSLSGRFEMQQGARLALTKTFDTPQDWSNFDRLLMDVRCTMLTHEAVYFYFVSSDGTQSTTYPLLSSNEVTSNADPSLDDFETRIFSISSQERTQVTQLVFYADDVTDDLVFFVDDIVLKRSQQYYSQGVIRLRYSASDPVVFNSLVTTAVLPTGTAVQARLRVADNPTDLSNALFTAFLSSAQPFALRGTYAEVEVDLFASSDLNYSPTLTSVELAMAANAITNGVTVNTLGEWSSGRLSNMVLTGTDSVTATIKPPVTVGDLAFLNQNVMSEVNSAGVPVFAITGNNAIPVSDVQAWAGLFGTTTYGLTNPLSCVRTSDRRFILCDTGNNRILVFNSDGTLNVGYLGMDQDADLTSSSAPIGITGNYNPITGVLWIGFSKTTTISATSYQNIVLEFDGQRINLADEGAISSTTTTTTNRVIGITLTPDHQAMLNGITGQISMVFAAAPATPYNSQFLGETYKVPVTVANVGYYQYIFSPVYAVESIDGTGRLWVCNATKFQEFVDASGVTQSPPVPMTRNLNFFDPNTDTGIFSNSVYFTTQFGGSIVETTPGNLTVAGVDTNYGGQIWLNGTATNPTILYSSPTNAQCSMITYDAEGNLWAAESSGTARAGRIVEIDQYGNILTAISGPYTQINSIQILNNADLLIGV